jgi:hypothetical protein
VVAVVVLAAIVFLALRSMPKEPIEAAPRPDQAHRVLIALTAPVADAATAAEVVRAAEARGDRCEFPADEVVLATGTAEDDPDGAAAARDLGERLTMHFEHVVTGPVDNGH